MGFKTDQYQLLFYKPKFLLGVPVKTDDCCQMIVASKTIMIDFNENVKFNFSTFVENHNGFGSKAMKKWAIL